FQRWQRTLEKEEQTPTPSVNQNPKTPSGLTDAEWTDALRTDLGFERFLRVMPNEWRPKLKLRAGGQFLSRAYTFATGTIGGGMCVRDLVEKTRWIRQFRGAKVYPVVALSDTFMKTRFGGRQRPHFLIKRWITFGGSAALAEAEAPKLAGPAAEPT